MESSDNICYLGIASLHAKLKSKEISAVEIVEKFFERISNIDTGKINAFITVTKDIARKQAECVDNKIADNAKLNLLDGIPIGIKDNFCTKGIRTTSASKMLENFVPNYNASVVEKLFGNGAVMLGKMNMDEFAMGSSNLYSAFGSVMNPWSCKIGSKLTPGGSSGGSAASVASFCCVASIGSDTGGSVRQPASFCGIVGLKPTYGRFSRWGMMPLASSLDHPGIFTRSIEDMSIMFDAMSGHDYKDSTSAQLEVTRMTEKLQSLIDTGVHGLKIGIPKEFKEIDVIGDNILQMWDEAIQSLAQDGAEIEYVSIPYIEEILSIYYSIVCVESSSNFAKYDGIRYGARVETKDYDEMFSATRSKFFGNEIKRRLIGGAVILSQSDKDYYKKAMILCDILRSKFEAIFQKCDCILLPTTVAEAFGFDYSDVDPIAMYVNDIFTIIANLTGLPAMSIPFKLSNRGLPLGMQIIAKHFNEEMLLKVGAFFEQKSGILVNEMQKSEYNVID